MPTVPRYLHAFDAGQLPQVFCDVLVVGGGIAGNVAALSAAARGARVVVLTKVDRLESNTRYAQGGLAATILEGDSPSAHARDTEMAGDGLCHVDVVRAVTREAPEVVATLREWGVLFDREEDGAALALGREGGHSERRIVHSRGDATGDVLQQTLAEAVMGTDGIRAVEGAFAIELLTSGGRCCGALVLYRRELRVVWAGCVVLATGGAGRLFRESTNPTVATGDGIAMAYRAGAAVRDMEFMQFHPTVLYMPGAARKLLSEAARGEGAVIRDQEGRRFLSQFDPRGELAPRDIVCRGIVSHLLARGDTHVLLDLSGIPAERLQSRLPGVVATGKAVGIDVSREPLPVRPAAHYTIGGVAVGDQGQTSVDGLLAAGEVTSSGLHGANRLASNSLLEGVVYGRRAGLLAFSVAAEQGIRSAPDLRAETPGPAAGELDAGDIARSVESLLWRYAGVRRTGAELLEAREELDRWNRLALSRTMGDVAGLEAQNLGILARLLVEAALMREETRGAHWRIDHPTRRDDRFLGHVVQRRGEETVFEPLGQAPDGAAAR